jgi:hypothetical protein
MPLARREGNVFLDRIVADDLQYPVEKTRRTGHNALDSKGRRRDDALQTFRTQLNP